MKRVLTLIAVSGVALGCLASTSSAATIKELVEQSGGPGEFDTNRYDYDILLNALLAAGLDGALDNAEDDLTVFAPNDRAFIRLARDLDYKGPRNEQDVWDFLLDNVPLDLLTDILTYHVAPESLDLIDVILASIFGETIPTLQGETIEPFFFIFIDNEPALRNPRLFVPFNVRADNGIIHTINRVLIPFPLSESP